MQGLFDESVLEQYLCFAYAGTADVLCLPCRLIL